MFSATFGGNFIKGGTVKQSTFFVTEGAHDSVTFTFTPENAEEAIAVNFEINGEVVTDVIDPATNTYVLEDADTIAGSIQVTGVTFTSVETYGQTILDSAINEIVKADKGLDLHKNDATKTPFVDEDDLKENEYSAEAALSVQGVYDDGCEAVAKAVESAKKDHKEDVKAQLDAVKTAADAEATKVKEAYTKAVADAKVLAKEDLQDLVDELTREEYVEEDVKAQQDTYTAQIDAVTTIEGLGSVISGNEVLTSFGKNDPAANRFYGLKAKAFEEIEAALETVETKYADDIEDLESKDSNELKTNLEKWGVDETQLPSKVAEEEMKKVSAATEINWVEDKTNGNHTDVGYAGATAVKATVTGIKDTVLKNIKAAYHKEINESKALADTESTRTALLGVVDTAISNFVTADKDKNTLSLSQYVKTTWDASAINEDDKSVKDVTKLNLIGYIEYCLTQPVNGSVNTAFANERVENAKKTALETLKAAQEKITDATYKALTSYTTTNNVKYISSQYVTKKGSVSSEIENPFFDGITVENNKVKVTGVKEVEPNVTVGDKKATYNLSDWYTTLSKATITKQDDDIGTLYVQVWATEHAQDFKKIYVEGLKTLKTALTGTAYSGTGEIDDVKGVAGAISLSGLPGAYALGEDGKTYDQVTEGDDDYLNAATLTNDWNKLNQGLTLTTEDSKIKNVDALVTFADGVTDNAAALRALNDGLKAWLTDEDGVLKDDKVAYKKLFGTKDSQSEASLLRKEFNDKKAAALEGKLTEAAAKTWTRASNLNKLYEEDVAAYLVEAQAIAKERHQYSIPGVTSVADKLERDTNYEALTNAVGHYVVKADGAESLDLKDVSTWKTTDTKPTQGTVGTDYLDYTCESITSIDEWLKKVIELLPLAA